MRPRRRPLHVGSCESSVVTCVIAKTKTRSKKSSSGVTRSTRADPEASTRTDASDSVLLWAVRLEAVAHAGLGDEVARARRIGLELAPDLGEVDAQVVRLRLVLGAPHLLKQLALRDELARVADEHLDDMPLGRREPDLAVAGADALGREVDREVGGLDDGFLVGGRGSPQGCAEPGEELVHPERLRHVVVGAGVEGRDLPALLLPHREDDDRDRGPAAQAADHLDAVDPGQAEVEHDEVGVLARRDGECRLAARRELHVVAARTQVRPERAQDLRLVVDDEDARHSAARSRVTIVSPPPGVLSTSISPPIASTNPFATARPSPTPSSGLESPSCWNGMNSRSTSAAGTPGPWSTTRTST